MANLWYNLKNNIKINKRRLYSLAGAALLFLILFWLTKMLNGRSLCLVYNLFGVKCIGCGMTRAFIALLKFDFSSAVQLNLLSIPLFLGIMIDCFLLALDLLFGKKLVIAFERFLNKKYMYFIYLLMFALSLLHLFSS